MRSVDCAECNRLWNDSVLLLQKYNAVLDTLSLPERCNRLNADRWIELANASERLHEAQGLERIHHDSHHRHDLMAKRLSDRRVSLVADRRRNARGGRRATDAGRLPLPPLLACAGCQTGTMGLVEFSSGASRSTAMYRCRDCGHQFDGSAG